MVPQDFAEGRKSKLHLIFQGQVSGSLYIYASLLTANNKNQSFFKTKLDIFWQSNVSGVMYFKPP